MFPDSSPCISENLEGTSLSALTVTNGPVQSMFRFQYQVSSIKLS